MASRGRGARAKGANYERELAHKFTESFNIEIKRGLAQTRGGGAEVPDVKMPLFHIEAKRQKKGNIRAALSQAIEDSENSGLIPVAIIKDDRQDPILAMRLDDWIEIAKVYLNAKMEKDKPSESSSSDKDN